MDRPLDDLLSSRPRRGGFKGPQRRRGGGGGGGGAFGHDDRLNTPYGHDDRSSGGAFKRSRVVNRGSTPYGRRVVGSVDTVWQHDRFDDEEEEEEIVEEVETGSNRRARGGLETGTKLQISNLAYSVLSEDLKDLFESVGDLKRATVNYDKSGRSLGTATVVFSRRNDALQALKEYNNVSLDDLPMKISLVATNSANGGGRSISNDGGANTFRSAINDALTISVGGQRNRRVISQGGGGGGGGRRFTSAPTRSIRINGGRVSRGAGRVARGGRGGGGGGRRSGFGSRDKNPPTAEELDAEMDAYIQEAV